MKCSELSTYICKFLNNTLTEYEKKELAVHLSICKKCKERVNIMLPTLVCINKYLSEDVVFDKTNNYIMKTIQEYENQNTEKLSTHILKHEVIFVD